MGKIRAPYGTWKSPISASSLATSPPVPDALVVDEVTLLPYHLERRPLEGGRIALIDSITRIDVLSKSLNVRTGVHEYGGGAVCVRNAVVYFSNFSDGRLYALDRAAGPDSQPVAITPGKSPIIGVYSSEPVAFQRTKVIVSRTLQCIQHCRTS